VRLTGAALLSAAVLLGGCSSGSHSTGSATTTGSADAQTVTVEMRDDLKFHPSSVHARVGTVTLHVSNPGLVPHDLTFDDDALGKTGTVDGKSAKDLKVTFSTTGTFSFVCTVHKGMTGEVVVS
jgi:plastocyanin